MGDHDQDAAGRWLVRAVAGGELDLPLPGCGRTLERFRRLAAFAATDVTQARLAEGHADALAILAELRADAGAGQVWGVWAARSDSVRARRVDGRWQLSGRRDWCSGAGTCTRALVTALADDGVRLFALDPRAAGVRIVPGSWPAVGMAGSDSRSLELSAAAATAVGSADAYTHRPGFWHGAIGVAACWYGGAVGVARALLTHRRSVAVGPGAEDPHALAHLGAVDSALYAARATLVAAATTIDANPRADLARLAAQVRAGVEAAATEVLTRVGRATGAGPLCQDRDHARRVADLTVYLRQSHAERDLAHLGTLALAELELTAAWDLPTAGSGGAPATRPRMRTARPGSAA